jgi:hypothetical protein
MDSVTGADHPCHGGLWVAVLAFHLALIERPRRPVVVAAVAFAMYYATGFRKALVKARKLHEASERTSIWGELAYVSLYSCFFLTSLMSELSMISLLRYLEAVQEEMFN